MHVKHPQLKMKSDGFARKRLSKTMARERKYAALRNKSRLQRLAEITQSEPDELREEILGELLDQIVGVETFELAECFVSPFYTKEQAEIVAERINALRPDEPNISRARVVNVGRRFAVKVA